MAIEPIIAIHAGVAWTGSYALRIRLSRTLSIPIGRLQRGVPLDFPAGDYVYAGSAQGAATSLALPRRLLRHATRSEGRPAHALRAQLLEHFGAAGVSLRKLTPSVPKRLHWNIDYLLDCAEADLTQVFYIRSPLRLEHALVACLEADCAARPLIPGFGAHDHPGHTHLFAVPTGTPWRASWQREFERIAGAPI